MMNVREHMAAAGYDLAAAWEPEHIWPEAEIGRAHV